MGTLSKIALFVFLVVGLLASANPPVPGSRPVDPFANARATPLPTRAGFQPLTPTQAARFRDERLDYYEFAKGDANWNGTAVLGAGGAGDQYQNCRNACATQNPQTAECYNSCDRQYTQSAATNQSQVYKFAPNGASSGSTTNGQIPTDGLRMPSSMGPAREAIKIDETQTKNPFVPVPGFN